MRAVLLTIALVLAVFLVTGCQGGGQGAEFGDRYSIEEGQYVPVEPPESPAMEETAPEGTEATPES